MFHWLVAVRSAWFAGTIANETLPAIATALSNFDLSKVIKASLSSPVTHPPFVSLFRPTAALH